ncbi:MAG: hypothetical protein JW775_06890, partial [Candidatus Aminicenantes bacterium]|nr:hypothetical protein [Candidatus Aminicenantes bacterium]
EIVKQEQMAFEQGVTEPWRLTLRQGKVVRRAIWKDAMGVRGGYLEGWRYEIAAYIMDKLLGVGMVPPTVEKARAGRPGSCQLWIDGTALLRDLNRKAAKRDALGSEAWKDAGYIAQFFDNLIGNEDRHTGNVLVTRDFRTILIDHSRTFRVGQSFVEGIPFSDKNVPPDELMRRLPRGLVDRTAALSEPAVRKALEGLLSDTEIGAVMARRDLLLLEVRKIIDRFGEANVLY